MQKICFRYLNCNTMSFFRKLPVKYLLLFMIFFHVVNSSVDAPDVFPDWIPENIAYNEIESITEWVVDVVIFGKNKVQEYDDNDNAKKKNSTLKKHIDFIDIIIKYCHSLSVNNIAIGYFTHNTPCSYNRDIHSPPPETII
jgi:hypothetical protein